MKAVTLQVQQHNRSIITSLTELADKWNVPPIRQPVATKRLAALKWVIPLSLMTRTFERLQ
ncbi:hypothetical protein [Alteromonas sp. a30]|uniref:hypothetical protein n=1 Tax=Alteromonas sp. a30 TaxID=2730917 RepID=UPI00227E52B7|nr:hypothetical protein [Alteromonas sp. a30]MCY7294261.1 hypothetical protein [Alteromonas sp. a30]